MLAYPNLSKELKKQKMQSLFEQIEMPLLFTLYDMEKVGILVEKEALHEYGAKLGERISELEADIYEDIPLQQKFLKNSVLRIRLWR